MGTCSPQCTFSCTSRCNPICCTSKIASRIYNPVQRLPFPGVGQPPLQLPRLGVPPPIGFSPNNLFSRPSNPCVRTPLNPCLPRTPLMGNRFPVPMLPKPVIPCVPKANKKCPPRSPLVANRLPFGVPPRLPFGVPPRLPIPCLPTPLRPCPPAPPFLGIPRPQLQPFAVPRAGVPPQRPIQVQYQIPIYLKNMPPPGFPPPRPGFPFAPQMAPPQMAGTVKQAKPPPFLKLSPGQAMLPQLPVFGLPVPQVQPRPFVFPRPQVPKCVPNTKKSCHPTVKKFEKLRDKSKAKLRKMKQKAFAANKPINMKGPKLPSLHVFYPNQPTIIKQAVFYQPVPPVPFGGVGQPMPYQVPPQAYQARPAVLPTKLKAQKAAGKGRTQTPRVAANPLFYSGAFGSSVPPVGNNLLPQLFQQKRLPYAPLIAPQYRPGFPPFLPQLQPQPPLSFNQPSAFSSQNKSPPFLKLSPGTTKPGSLPFFGNPFPQVPPMPLFSPYSKRIFSQIPPYLRTSPYSNRIISQIPPWLRTSPIYRSQLQPPLPFNQPPAIPSQTKPPPFLKLSPDHLKKPGTYPLQSSMYPQFPPVSRAPFPLPLMSMMKNPPRIIPQAPSTIPNFAQFQQPPLGNQLSVPPLQLPPGGPLQFPRSRAPFPLPLPSMMKNPPPSLRQYLNHKLKVPQANLPPRPPLPMFPQRPIGYPQPLSPYQSLPSLNLASRPPPFLKLTPPQKTPKLPFYGRPFPQQQSFLPFARPPLQPRPMLHPGLVRPFIHTLANRVLPPFQRNLMPAIQCPASCSKRFAFCPDYCPHQCCRNGRKRMNWASRLVHTVKAKAKSKVNTTTKAKSGKKKKGRRSTVDGLTSDHLSSI